MASAVAPSQVASLWYPRAAKPRTAGVAVVHEYRRQTGLRLKRGRHTADIAAVAASYQRQQSDRGVLSSV